MGPIFDQTVLLPSLVRCSSDVNFGVLGCLRLSIPILPRRPLCQPCFEGTLLFCVSPTNLSGPWNPIQPWRSGNDALLRLAFADRLLVSVGPLPSGGA